MNPIAFGMIAFGVLLFVLGLLLIAKDRKAAYLRS
jgi:hypothetical protein